ncbi:DNA polymerase III subunit beta [Arcanobacterium bovis]|uniref:Beta sliding clamp n=1 Tax=Arcanobacterium bovis TaxID=2529275 RepID=A0A4Q9V0M8_9ACTO|nr:DNA polymerase III subunit beta [Arcanobacterium bovis]TBW21035.1 DNA polymerase III subunit beta [Arcanobacterium bovis]
MKFQVERETFTEAVTWVARTIPNRPAIPVLAGLKIVASEEGKISLGSRDSDITSHIDIEGDIQIPGEILVNGKLLADICRSLPSKPILFSLEGTKLEIECGSARFSMKTMAMDDYSELPAMPPVVGTVDGDQWQEAVSQVTVAASNDDTLPMLVSVCIEIEGSSISLMATDRYRLAVRHITWEPTDSSINKRILVRGSRLLDIAKSLGTAGSVEISLEESGSSALIGFSAGGKQNTVQLIEGEYPQVRSLFPAEVAGYATIDRANMLDAIKRSRLVVEKNSAVRLSFTEGELVVEAGHGDAAQASEALEANLHGEDISLAFNPIFLQEGISVMSEQNIRLSYTHPTKPAVITQENDEGEADESFRMLLMPIRTFGSN